MLNNIFMATKGPWGTRDGNGDSGRNSSGRSPGSEQPELEDIIRNAQERMRNMMGNGGGSRKGGSGSGGFNGNVLGVGLLLIVIIWLLSGFYIIAPDEKGVVLRFGKYIQTTDAGPNYHLPWPIEQVIKPKVTTENIVEVGFSGSRLVRTGMGRVAQQRLANNQIIDIPQESLMLTGDENIVDLDFTVRWRIRDARDFLFNVTMPEASIKHIAESAMREVMGKHPIDGALANNKTQIEFDAKELLQKVVDEYKMGVRINAVELQQVQPPREVKAAFEDVQAARADAERMQNEAIGYANDIIPRARGQVAQIMQEAEGYKASKVAEATGAAKRFESQLIEYRKAKQITRSRLYIETMEEVLKDNKKVIISKDASGGILPYLPLNELSKGRVK